MIKMHQENVEEVIQIISESQDITHQERKELTAIFGQVKNIRAGKSSCNLMKLYNLYVNFFSSTLGTFLQFYADFDRIER